MFEFEGKSYDSKADCIRWLYDEGEVKMDSTSKKAMAKRLGITVQTVHATLVKHVGPSKKSNVVKVKDDKKESKQVKVEKAKVKQIFATYKGMEFPLSPQGRLLITQSPNPFDLPVTNPPIEIEL